MGVQADRDRVGRGVRAQSRGAGRDHPPGHDRGLAGGPGGGVEVFEGVDGGGVRVEFEPALWRGDAGQAVLAGHLVDATGTAVGDPVDRPPPFGVGVVAGVELAAQSVDVLGVLGRCRLGGQQRDGGVTQPEQGGEFAGLAGRDLVLDDLAVDDDAEPAAVGHVDVAVLVLGRGVGPQHPVDGRGGGAGAEQRPGRVVAAGAGQLGVQAGAQLERDVDVAAGLDLQLGAELARPDASRADDPLRVFGEVAVDGDLPVGVAADGHGARPPVSVARPVGGVAAAQHEHVGDHLGSGGALVCGHRQPDGGEQVGHGGDLAAGGRVGGVHRVVAGQHRHDAAGAGQREGLDDEVVVQRVVAAVVHGIVEGDLAERHVADDQVEVVARDAGVGEGLLTDVGARVEVLGDRRGGRVQLDTEQGAVLRSDGGRGQADEGARAAARLEHADRFAVGAESCLGDDVPHRLRDRGVGVVRVEGGLGGGPPLALVEQLLQLGAGGGEPFAAFVEHGGDGTPSRPAGEHLLLVGGGGPVGRLQLTQQAQRGDVGGDLRGRAGRGEVVLGGGPERCRR